ncbi:alpha/beta hydrolase [soil metagenome]
MIARVPIRKGSVELAASVVGEGPPLVWVAGLGDDLASWNGQAERFADRYTCVTFDNRGCGESSTPEGPYTTEDMAIDVHELVRTLGLGPARVVGSSMGGAICQAWAAQYPDDVTALVLTNSWAAPTAQTNLLFDHWIALAAAGEGRRLAEAAALFSFSPNFLQKMASEDGSLELADIPRLRGFEAAAQACRTHDARGYLDLVLCPTLVLGGEQDILTPLAHSHELVRLIRDARLETIDSGHMIFSEQPLEFAAVVGAFFR